MDDETTDIQLYALLRLKGFNISVATILRAKTALGWTLTASSFKTPTRSIKRLEWAKANLTMKTSLILV